MSRVGLHHFKAALAAVFSSLEKRLIGALLLIVICTGTLHFISQNRAGKLRAVSEELGATAGNAERAAQLLKSVSQFRLATRLYLTPSQGDEKARASDELTDAAIQIGDQLNAMRLSGMTLYEMPEDAPVFNDLDRQIGRITRAADRPDDSQAARNDLENNNMQMVALAGAIQARANAARDEAFDRLKRSTRSWQALVTTIGSITVMLVVLILLDLVLNILPALRRMHASLRRLAEGDLDFEIENFKLRELQALSGPLETFRRNAHAVQNLAFTDPSTGLPNRRAFFERTTARLAMPRTEGECGFAVILADVDRFKHVNDDYGHAAGDQLVQLIAKRMADELGESAIIARMGGDEFALCVPLREGILAAALGSRLVTAMRSPFDLGDFKVAVTMSLGLTETEGGGSDCDVNALLHRADLALYASKNGGRNRATGFTEHLAEERELNRALERDLAKAFCEGQLRMVYQPIHAVENDCKEVEALVRWRHPVLGDIPPSRFIPAAERSGMMVQLGAWIIERALGDLTRWPDLSMSLNLSPLQLQQDGFVGFLTEHCRRNGITSDRVILEVTESLSIERNTRALLTLELLRNSGFRIALDDFGTGYSSLCMMKTFKFDRLKLDRSLISDLSKDPTSRAVFEAAVTMALRIGAEVVAEGIAVEELIDPVRSAGCTHLQGYHYSEPIEADGVEAYYRNLEAGVRKVA